jgi:hypothetical protein
MKKLLCAIALGALAYPMSTDAMAQGASRDIPLVATVNSFCRIDGQTGPAPVGNVTINVDSDTGVVTPTTANVNIGDVRCNKAATLVLSSLNGALISGVSTDPGFANYINYTATMTVPAALTLTANSVTGGTVPITNSVITGGARNNTGVVVVIASTGPALPLMPGSYSDTVTVSLTPTP